MIKFLILLFTVWFSTNFFYALILRSLKHYNHQVMTVKFNPILETFNVFSTQFSYLKLGALWFLERKQKEQLQERKATVLRHVVNHLNQTLTNDLGIRITHPATTGGVDVWIYLAKKPDELVYKELEDYFIGVIVKYSSEFALDFLTIEMVSGAGWVAKFDVKGIQEASHNRMARASEVETKEDFEDIDLW